MNTEAIPTEDILAELKRRRSDELRELREALSHRLETLSRLEAELKALEDVEPAQPTAEQLEQTPPPTAAPEESPKFGPCATRILQLIMESKVPLSEAELLRCTRYSTVMFRKATTELMVTGKIQRMGEARKYLFHNTDQKG